MLGKYLESLQWKSLRSCKTLFSVCIYLGWVFPVRRRKIINYLFLWNFWDGILHLKKQSRYLSFTLCKAEKNSSKFYRDFPSWTSFRPSPWTEDADGLKDKAHKAAANPGDHSHSGLSMWESFPFHSLPLSVLNPTASFSLEAAVLPSLPTQLWTALIWWKESLIICVVTVF